MKNVLTIEFANITNLSMRVERIKTSIQNSMDPQHMEIVDESHMHAGRAGQESHFKLLVVSESFLGKSRVQRQRSVNELMKIEFDQGLHALSMRLLTPEEYARQTSKFETPDCAGQNKA